MEVLESRCLAWDVVLCGYGLGDGVGALAVEELGYCYLHVPLRPQQQRYRIFDILGCDLRVLLQSGLLLRSELSYVDIAVARHGIDMEVDNDRLFEILTRTGNVARQSGTHENYVYKVWRCLCVSELWQPRTDLLVQF